MLATAVLVLMAYIAIGITICFSKPWVSKRRQAAFGAAMGSYGFRRSVRRIKMLLFRASTVLGLVFLWPVFLIDERRESKARNRLGMAYEKAHPFLGFTFDRIGGKRVFICNDCNQTLKVDPGHGSMFGNSRGYQCQTCGECTTRYYGQPFAHDPHSRGDEGVGLDDVLPQYRAEKIEHLQGMFNLIDRQMRAQPREKWFKSWEPDLARYREELDRVSPEELASIKSIRAEVNAAYDASLVCDCGGPLDRDQVLFCPGCRSKKLELLARLEMTICERDPVLGLVPVIEGNRLHHSGVRYRLRVAPLEKYIQQYQPEIGFSWNNDSSLRGYKGTWEIKDRRLYLTHLAEFSGRTKQHHPTTGPDVLRTLFPKAGEDGLFADDFNGTLRCPYGEELHFVKPGFASTYPHELVLRIENGVLISEEVENAAIPPIAYPRAQGDRMLVT